MNFETIRDLLVERFGNQMQPVREEIEAQFPLSREFPIYDWQGNLEASFELCEKFFWLKADDCADMQFEEKGAKYEMWFHKGWCYARKCTTKYGYVYQTAVEYQIRTHVGMQEGYVIHEDDVKKRFLDFPYLLVRKGLGHEYVTRVG
jgi:hypothetical protein